MDLRRSLQPRHALAYVYCKTGDSLAGRSSGIASTILRQLCLQTNYVDSILLSECRKNHGQGDLSMDWFTIKEAIVQLLKRYERTYLVFDALNECKDHRKMIELLVQLKATTPSSMRIFITSTALGIGISFHVHADAEIIVDEQTNADDIKHFIDENVNPEQLTSLVGKPKLMNEVKAKLYDKAKDSFLWVSHVVQSLQNLQTSKQILEAVESTPPLLKDFYQRCIERITTLPNQDDRDAVIEALFWILNSARPLNAAELLKAITIPLAIENQLLQDQRMTAAGIVQLCANLIIIDEEERAVLRHSSFKKYIDDRKNDSETTKATVLCLRDRAKHELARKCLLYLKLDNFRLEKDVTKHQRRALLSEHPFMAYVQTYWAKHVHAANFSLVDGTLKELAAASSQRELLIDLYLDPAQKASLPQRSSTTVLHFLACFGLHKHFDSFDGLEAMIDQFDNLGDCPLELAMRSACEEACSWILSRADSRQLTRIDKHMKTSALHRAAQLGWCKVIRTLLSLGFDDSRREGPDSSTALMVAAKHNRADAVRALVDEWGFSDFQDQQGNTALAIAAAEGNAHVVTLLLEAECDADRTNSDGYTALHLAMKEQRTDTIHALLPYTGAWSSGLNLIHLAALQQCSELILPILQREDTQINCATREENISWATCGATPLHYAARGSCLQIVDTLLDQDADIYARDKFEEIPIHDAVILNQPTVIGRLLEHPNASDMIHVEDLNGSTLMHLAIHRTDNDNDDTASVLVLIEHGVSMEAQDSEGHTALHRALLYNKLSIAEELIKQGADLRWRTTEDETALHLAISGGRYTLVKAILEKGVDYTAMSKTGRTPLIVAIEADFLEVIQWLFKRDDVDKSVGDKRGTTALHVAARQGCNTTVKAWMQLTTLLRPNIDGEVPLHFAAQSGHLDCVESLLECTSVDVQDNSGRSALW